MKKLHLIIYLLLFHSCNVIDQEPLDAVSNEMLFTRASDAEGAIIGAYRQVAAIGQNYVLMAEIPTKNVLGNALNRQYEQMNNLLFLDDNGFYQQLWTQNYLLIARANMIIKRVPEIPELPEESKNAVVAEARFLRAFAYFNLVRYFGDVPLITEPTTSPNLNELQVPRNDKTVVLQQVMEDLDFAKINLRDTYTSALATKARATKAAAYALATRIHLFQKDYAETISNANEVIAIKGSALTVTYASLFETRNTDESIFEINYDNQATNTLATTFLPGSLAGVRMLQVNQDILAVYETGDVRKTATFGFADGQNYVKKYFRATSGTDNVIVFRLAEVLLSKAEALAEISYPNQEAINLLNEVRRRAGLAAVNPPDIQAFRNQLYKDRRLELAYEGHEWFDLVRTDRLDDVLGITDPNKSIWPVPSVEILRNPNLQPQNPGY